MLSNFEENGKGQIKFPNRGYNEESLCVYFETSLIFKVVSGWSLCRNRHVFVEGLVSLSY